MNTATIRPSDCFGAVQAALEVLDRLTEIADGETTTTIAVDELSFQAAFREGSALPVDELIGLAHEGHASEIRVEQAGWSLTVRADGAANPVIDEGGPAEDFLDASELKALGLAVQNGNASDALRAVSRLSATIRITVRHRSDIVGFHWVATTEALCQLLTGDHWAQTLDTITTGPTMVAVGDAGDTFLTCRHLVVCGLDAEYQQPPLPSPVPPARREARRLPSPVVFADAHTNAPNLERLLELLQGAARTAVWFHLATDARIEADGRAELLLEGARSVELHIRPADVGGDASTDIALYEWATSTADPAVLDAVTHAASLAITNTADVRTAAAPVLRTARTLYELSRQGAIAEALATRRSARQAALDAARSAAAAARAVASKAVERSLIQAAAAVAVVLTNAARLIGQMPALLLLALIILLSVISLVAARRVELPNAEAAMRAELDDLESYREALSEDDLVQIRDLRVVDEAKQELHSAVRTATWVYVTTLIAVAAVGFLLVALQFNAPAGTPTPTPTVPSPPVP